MSGDGASGGRDADRHAETARGADRHAETAGGGVRARLAAGRRTARLAAAERLGLGPATVEVVGAIVVLGLAARLAWLGARGAHFDEGRVAYWALRYAETGHFEYRYIIHGPLVQHADRWLFALVGPSDFVARLPVALVGAALPLVALWYRDHLRDVEVVAMAALLAVNPILLYYSRFLRSDLLVATFMLATLGALLRLHATRRPRYLHAAAALAAFGFASKENAVVYVLCWLGAAALVAEPYLSRPRDHATAVALVRDRWAAVRDRAAATGAGARRRWAGHLLGAGAGFLLLVLLLFAPRAGSAGGPGLWRVFAEPAHLPVVLRATAVDVAYGYGYWFGGAAEAGCNRETLVAGYACYLRRMAVTLAQFGAATAVLAAVGAVRERYATADPRPLVAFAALWGVASFLGYPLGTDIWAAWVATHVVVPLTIPAAAGVGAAVDAIDAGFAADRERLVAVPVAALLVLGGLTGYAAVDSVYVDDSTRDHRADMVQYAQPDRGIKPAVAAMEEAVAGHDDGPDVLYHGERFHLPSESAADQPPVPESADPWFERLPLPWYTQAMGAETASTRTLATLRERLADRPPVVIADPTAAPTVRDRVEGYRTFRFDLRAPVDGPSEQSVVVVFVDERRLDRTSVARPAGADRGPA